MNNFPNMKHAYRRPQARAIAASASAHAGTIRVMRVMLILSALVLMLSQAFAQSGYQPGDQVRDFSLESTDGKMVSFKNYPDAKGFILIFTCNHCPYAKMYEQRIIDLHKAFAPKGYPVIAINPNGAGTSGEGLEDMQKRAKAKSYPFPYVADATQEVTKAYGAKRTPEVFLVQKTSNGFVLKYTGAIDNNPTDGGAASEKYVEQAIQALTKGASIASPVTKSVGCGIKWKAS
jgi:peroxiredoxin